MFRYYEHIAFQATRPAARFPSDALSFPPPCRVFGLDRHIPWTGAS